MAMSVFCTDTRGLGSASEPLRLHGEKAAGKDFPLSKLNDKEAILVVNVASQCA